MGVWSGIDAGACLVKNGDVICGISEERLARVKHYSGFPEKSINYVLKSSNVLPEEVSAIVITNRIYLKYLKRMFQRNKMKYAVESLFLKFWRRQKILGKYYPIGSYKKNIRTEESLNKKINEMGINASICIYDHHLIHAMYGYYLSGYDNAISISLDGEGNGLSGMVVAINKGKCEVIQEIGIHGLSMGLFYGCVTEGLGFKPHDGEGKTMGLAPFGKLNDDLLEDIERIAPKVINGEFRANHNLEYLTAVSNEGIPRAFFRDSYYVRALVHKYGKENVAATAQHLLEERVCSLIKGIINNRYYSKNLILNGGVALNVSNNCNIWRKFRFEKLYIPPAPGDMGLPMALALHHAEQIKKRKHGKLKSPYNGREYSEIDILKYFKEFADRLVIKKSDNICLETAKLLIDQKIVGWFHGKSEWGNRALGARSVLADPRTIVSKERINKYLKERDWFMPFAPSVLAERCEDIFENYCEARFMNHKFYVKENWKDKIPAVVHIDGSARPHTVSISDNPYFYKTIKEFCNLTDVPLVLNTSFNKHGLPIVETPKDAFEHLIWNCVDVLVLGSFTVTKKEALE